MTLFFLVLIESIKISDAGRGRLLDTLETNSTLLSLGIGGCFFFPFLIVFHHLPFSFHEILLEILEWMISVRSLRWILLSQNCIWKVLFHFLTKGLFIKGNNIGDQGLICLSDVLKNNSSINLVNLSTCSFYCCFSFCFICGTSLEMTVPNLLHLLSKLIQQSPLYTLELSFKSFFLMFLLVFVQPDWSWRMQSLGEKFGE